MKIYLLGMNHRTAPVELRECFAARETGPLLQKLVANDEIDEAVLVSTCNRVDLIVATRHLESARHVAHGFFLRELGGEVPLPAGHTLADYTYEHHDSAAMCHVFRVAAAMDSMVVGEPQILGQMKDAYRVAVEHGTCGPILSRLFQRAFATAKRVKNETRISQRPVSVARVAVDLARQIFENLQDKTALLVGAGEMIEMALFALQREGLGGQLVANRTRERAQALAERFTASAHGLDELDDLLPRADVVLTCIGGDGPIVTRDQVKRALRKRRSRPIFFIDIGVPRNVEASVDELDSAYLYDMDDLQDVAAANAEHRQREADVGEDIVNEEQQRFDGWLVALRAVPTIRHLVARADEIRELELGRQVTRLELSDEQREGIDLLTRAVVNKILHAPITRLRAETDSEGGLALLEAARELFALDDPEAPGASADASLDELLRAGAFAHIPLDGLAHLLGESNDVGPDADADEEDES